MFLFFLPFYRFPFTSPMDRSYNDYCLHHDFHYNKIIIILFDCAFLCQSLLHFSVFIHSFSRFTSHLACSRAFILFANAHCNSSKNESEGVNNTFAAGVVVCSGDARWWRLAETRSHNAMPLHFLFSSFLWRSMYANLQCKHKQTIWWKRNIVSKKSSNEIYLYAGEKECAQV